jgi:hypothetical protein
MRRLQRILRWLPLTLLILLGSLWMTRSSFHLRGVIWIDRFWLFSYATPEHLRIIAHCDTSNLPFRSTWPYLRVWRWVDAGEDDIYSEPLAFHHDYFDGIAVEHTRFDVFGPRPVVHHFLGAGFSHGSRTIGTFLYSGTLEQHIVIDLPWWMPLAFFASLISLQLVQLVRHWKDHRFLPGHCSWCGYDLRASPQRCPECGANVDLSGVHDRWHRQLAPAALRGAGYVTAHPSASLAMAVALPIVFALALRPPRPVVPLLPAPGPPIGTPSTALYSVTYNLLDLWYPRRTLDPQFIRQINAILGKDDLDKDRVVLCARVTAADHARITHIINQWRGGAHD